MTKPRFLHALLLALLVVLPLLVSIPAFSSSSVNATEVLVKAYKSLPSKPNPLAKCKYCHAVKPGVTVKECYTCHMPGQRLGSLNTTLHRIHGYLTTPCILFGTCGPICKMCHRPGMVPPLHKLGHPDEADAKRMGKDLYNCRECHYIPPNGKGCMMCHREGMPHIPGFSECTECHGVLPSPTLPRKPPHIARLSTGKHSKLAEKYGFKDNCQVCHDKKSGYTLLVMLHGSPVPYSQVDRFCGQSGCHPKKYQEWLAGKHHSTKPYGFSGDLCHCTNPWCHNPHRPYIPPPGTLEEFLKKQVVHGWSPEPLGMALGILAIVYVSIFIYHRIGGRSREA